jgi:diguanylate cyclase (GGDEF)-like protein/PAS domain S-box-containing protein
MGISRSTTHQRQIGPLSWHRLACLGAEAVRAHLRAGLPRGGLLPASAWQRRHRGILALLWLHALGFVAFAIFNPTGLTWHSVSEVGLIGALAALATWRRPGRLGRTALASLGLIASSALLVHLSEGVIEMHFHFFVALAVIALYEDWLPFLLALAYVVFDHGLLGALAPSLIYGSSHPDASVQPWKWATIHAAFVLAASTASVIHWRLGESERERASAEQAQRIRAQAARKAADAEIAARKQVEATLQQQAAVLAEQARLLDLAHDAILVWELQSGVIRFWNRGAQELYGWTKDEVLGRTPQGILQTEFPRPLAELNGELMRTGRWEGELVHSRQDGTRVAVLSRWALQADTPNRPATVLALNSDITAQKRAQAALEHQALHDALTSLPNRALLNSRLQSALNLGRHDGSPVALLMLDLDRFKEVNDTLGHQAGDALLRQVGPRLLQALRESDTLARLGGDEFAVLLPRTSPEGAQVVARNLLQVLEQPFVLECARLTVGASIGIALYPQHGADAESLLRCADVAMYLAKREASGSAVYAAHQDQHTRDRLALVSDLRRAIDEHELTLHFQPKLDCRRGTLAGLEALVRWQHPVHGLIPPDHFIPLAEQMGLIRALGRCVQEMALAACREWRAEGAMAPVAGNGSMRELLDPELPTQLEQLLARCDAEPSWLRLELTESSLMVEPTRALETLTRLRELGIQMSVDDYGTGYSSLRYLQQLPVDELKIDRSFVRSMVTNDSDLTIVRSTIELGHALGLHIVAEGVEDAATWARLGQLGCDQAQGYFLSRPLPLADLLRWLHESAQAPIFAAAA